MLEMLLELWAVLWKPPLSMVTMGAIGGVAHTLMLWRFAESGQGPMPRPSDFVLRPIFGAIAAPFFTVTLSLPNHYTSFFAGYFGIDVIELAATEFKNSIMDRVTGKKGD